MSRKEELEELYEYYKNKMEKCAKELKAIDPEYGLHDDGNDDMTMTDHVVKSDVDGSLLSVLQFRQILYKCTGVWNYESLAKVSTSTLKNIRKDCAEMGWLENQYHTRPCPFAKSWDDYFDEFLYYDKKPTRMDLLAGLFGVVFHIKYPSFDVYQETAEVKACRLDPMAWDAALLDNPAFGLLPEALEDARAFLPAHPAAQPGPQRFDFRNAPWAQQAAAAQPPAVAAAPQFGFNNNNNRPSNQQPAVQQQPGAQRAAAEAPQFGVNNNNVGTWNQQPGLQQQPGAQQPSAAVPQFGVNNNNVGTWNQQQPEAQRPTAAPQFGLNNNTASNDQPFHFSRQSSW